MHHKGTEAQREGSVFDFRLAEQILLGAFESWW